MYCSRVSQDISHMKVSSALSLVLEKHSIHSVQFVVANLLDLPLTFPLSAFARVLLSWLNWTI